MKRLIILVVAATLSMSGAEAQSTDAVMQRKLALSQQYIDLQHWRQRSEDTASRQLKLSWQAVAACKDDKCRSMLDQDILDSIRDAIPAYERAEVELLANRLTEDELRAAVTFAKSPEGQAIIATETSISDDVASINHDFSKRAGEGVLRSFCSQQAEACARMADQLSAKASSKP